MALKSRSWACPDCEGQFTTLMDDRDGPPKFCQLCGNDMSADQQPIPFFSRVGKATDGGLDKVYRGMEQASKVRAEQAAEMLGVPVSEVPNVKISDMKDNVRAGETSFIAPSQSKVAAPPPTNVSAMPGTAGLATAAMIKGQGGSIGNNVLDGFRKTHYQRAAQMQRAGQMGAYTGK